MRQIVLDTETTGLHPEEGHKIIEIGCIELVNRKFTGRRYHQYINPQRPIEEAALAVHGITNQFLDSKPIFSTIAKEFMEFIKDSELIIHNAPFDLGFIYHEFKLAGIEWNTPISHPRVIDTLILARQIHIGQRNNLDALCKRYKVDNSHRDLHGALMDAHLLAQVYLAMTGGQGSLFDELQTVELSPQVKPLTEKIIHKKRNLVILKATEEELLAHHDYLAKFSEENAW